MGYHNSQNLGVAPLAPFLKYTYEKYPKAFLSLKLGLVRTQTEIKQFCWQWKFSFSGWDNFPPADCPGKVMPETVAIANTKLCFWIPAKTQSDRLLPWPPCSVHPDLSSRAPQCKTSSHRESREPEGRGVDHQGLLPPPLNSPMGKDRIFLHAWWRASCMLFRGDNFMPEQTS